MKLGKKQATYGAVLGLAAVAFVIDRLCFSAENAGAATAPAAVEKSVPSQAPAATPVVATFSAESIPAGWLAERLRAATPGSDQTSRDVFALPACWRPAPKVAVASVATALAPKPQLFGETFRHEHHLVAVMIEAGTGRAVVDGKLISIGGSIDGFRLVSLSQQAARFVRGNEQVSLSIADSGNATGQ
jgi:hypothetical protein